MAILQLFAQWPGLRTAARLEDIVLIQTSLLLLCKWSCSNASKLYLHDKSREVWIKARSPPASLPFKGQDTEQTTVKWSLAILQRRSVLIDNHRTSLCSITKSKDNPLNQSKPQANTRSWCKAWESAWKHVQATAFGFTTRIKFDKPLYM